jgi:hypothetical protein
VRRLFRRTLACFCDDQDRNAPARTRPDQVPGTAHAAVKPGTTAHCAWQRNRPSCQVRLRQQRGHLRAAHPGYKCGTDGAAPLPVSATEIASLNPAADQPAAERAAPAPGLPGSRTTGGALRRIGQAISEHGPAEETGMQPSS